MKKWKYYIPIYGLMIPYKSTNPSNDELDDFYLQVILWHFVGMIPSCGVIGAIILYFIGHLK